MAISDCHLTVDGKRNTFENENFNACDNVKREKDFKHKKASKEKVKRFNNLNI